MAEKALPPAYAVLLRPHRVKDVVALGKSIVTAMIGHADFPPCPRRDATTRPSKGTP
jgi:hypothetical protein